MLLLKEFVPNEEENTETIFFLIYQLVSQNRIIFVNNGPVM